MNVLFFAPQYRPNLSNMIRTAEFYGMKQVYIFDQNKLLQPPHNKTSKAEMEHMAKVWTAGAIEFIDLMVLQTLEDTISFIQNYKGRIITTVIDPKAIPLKEFSFQKEDLIIMGNEKNGIPQQIVMYSTKKVFIPNQGKTNCLNVSTAFGIFLNQMSLDS